MIMVLVIAQKLNILAIDEGVDCCVNDGSKKDGLKWAIQYQGY